MDNPTNTDIVNIQPNIILITVDQLRFPMHLPPGIPDVDTFVATYMPKTYEYLWRDGVKFSNYYTAASDCTAARATIYTGLYAYQTYSMLTLITYPVLTDDPSAQRQPELNAGFPTIGHLMRKAGYDTVYFGKWHLSYDASDLERYGFKSFTPPEDFIGEPGQGMEVDGPYIASPAAKWVTDRITKEQNPKPFFLAVNFVNPHDKQWYWGGMQANNFNAVYNSIPPCNGTNENPPRAYVEIANEDDPPGNPYTAPIKIAIPNWESEDELKAKPSTQTLIREVFQYQMGGIYEEDKASTYTPPNSPQAFAYAVTPLHPGNPSNPCDPSDPTLHKAMGPEDYWTTALNSYIQLMGMVDGAIDTFMKNIPAEVRKSAVFVFTSDHGEYGSSHGLQGKGGTVYDEGIRVPLIVHDQAGFFTKDTGVQRAQLTSSVDLLPMIVSLAYGGDKTKWMTGDYLQLYGTRCNLLDILARINAPGREYAFHSTDEFVSDAINFNDSPLHVIGQIQMGTNGKKQKLGVYTNWAPDSLGQVRATVLNNAATQKEFYDYQNEATDQNEPLERESTPQSQAAQDAIAVLFGPGGDYNLSKLHLELQAPLPLAYLDAQATAYRELQNYMLIANTPPSEQSSAEVKKENQHRLARVWAY